MDDFKAIVIDNGSDRIKAGFSGEDYPRAVFRPVVARPREKEDGKVYVDYQAEIHRDQGTHDMKCPLSRSLITEWADMEEVWRYTFFSELRVDPSSYCVLLTEAPLNPRKSRERLIQIMFEVFRVQAVYVTNCAVLALAAAGYETGIVVDTGYEATHAVAIHEGYLVPHAALQIDIGGYDLSMHLMYLLAKRGYSFTITPEVAERGILREIKERFCYCAFNYEDEILRAAETNEIEQYYTLSDQISAIKINEERFKCPELFFKPQMTGKQCTTLPELVHEAIDRCNKVIQQELCQHIVLCGGSTLFPGMAPRLKRELDEIRPNQETIVVHELKDRKYLAWIGGSIISFLSTFDQNWIKRHDRIRA